MAETEQKRRHRHKPDVTVNEDVLEIEKAPRKEDTSIKIKTPEELEKAEKKKKYIKYAVIAGCVGVFILLCPLMYKGLLLARSDTQLEQNEMVMSDLTGYNEADAVALLKSKDLTPVVFYTYDQYTENGAVIKTSQQPGTIVTKGSKIMLYICDDSMPLKNIDYSLIETPEVPFIKDSIDVTEFNIVDDKFNIVIQNKQSFCITALEYEIVYENEYRENIGGKKYQISDIQILPGEKYVLEEKIQNGEAKYITVAGFRYQTKSVPENPR